VVQVTTAVEVDRRLQGNLGGDVTLGLSLLELLNGVVVVGDIGVVVVLVVDLHDLAGDGGLKGAIVVCGLCQWTAACCTILTGVNPNTPKHRSLQDRSGRVALPRAKVKPAAPVLKEAEAPERRATRAEVERRAAIVYLILNFEERSKMKGYQLCLVRGKKGERKRKPRAKV
jgi:hypothetical protein